MKVVKCSASAINTYYNCPFCYFLHYILGLELKAGKAALQGSIVHQALGWMAKLRKRGKTTIDPSWLLNRAWDTLVAKHTEIEMRKTTTLIDKETGNFKEAADFKKCRVALETIFSDEFYNPYNINVIDVEKWFTMEIPGNEWKCFDENGKSHQFTVRGFIDLVHEIDAETIEIIDWKTGNRKDFYTQQPVDEQSLTQNVQSRLYHLASYFLYPQYKNIFVTFYYANNGGPITIALSYDNLSMTIAALYRFFTTIKGDTLICRNRHWTCKMCGFNRDDICSRIWSDLNTFGSEYVKNKYIGECKK